MVDVADVTNGNRAPEAPAEPTDPQQRVWSMPQAPASRSRTDEMSRVALQAATASARFVAGAARHGARILREIGRTIASVPPALQLFAAAGVAMLVGVVGSIALPAPLGLICTVVVVPVCSVTLGALGHRWYSRLAIQTDQRAVAPATSDLQRSVEYVDKKLAVALTSLGSDRHQQAVIALFQAKTAVELTLGTEQDSANYVDVPRPADDHTLRPRIRLGSASKSPLRESNSLAAS